MLLKTKVVERQEALEQAVKSLGESARKNNQLTQQLLRHKDCVPRSEFSEQTAQLEEENRRLVGF